MRASATSTRVNRGFAFVDLCGFTDFVDTHGDAAGVAELGRLRSSVREVAPLCGVRVDKWLGDGAMLVGVDSGILTATAPVATEVAGFAEPVPVVALSVRSGRSWLRRTG